MALVYELEVSGSSDTDSSKAGEQPDALVELMIGDINQRPVWGSALDGHFNYVCGHTNVSMLPYGVILII